MKKKSPRIHIQNSFLRVSYDLAGHMFVVSKARTSREFVRDGQLGGGGGKARISGVRNQIFGHGRRITVRQTDGSTVTLELYPQLPFVLLNKTLVNAGAYELDLTSTVPATFKLELGEKPEVLRTLGTGGLLSADRNPGSYVFLACAVPATRRGVVAGWLTQDRGSGVVFSSVNDGLVEFKAQIDYGHLRIPAGKSAILETLAIGIFDDARVGLELFADAIKAHYKIQLRPRSAVYCTWYSDQHGGAGDEASTVALAEFAARELAPFGLNVVQIDDGWQDGPQLDGPTRRFVQARPDGPYPHGIAPIAEAVGKLGLTLGLWWLPFGRNHTDPGWRERQDWFARWADGTPMRTLAFGGTCLDLTHPAVKKHLVFISRLYRKWGVKYYKMDGLWTGTATEQVYINDGYKDDRMQNVAPFHDPSKTQIEAFRNGLKLLRQAAGNDVFFSGCCVSQNMRSFGGSFGLVDAMRVGPDFNHDNLGIKTGPIRASRLYFLNGRVWWNDPDPTKVRASDAVSSPDAAAKGAVTLDMARLATSFTALTGQFFLLSDWLPALAEERLEVLKRTMLSNDGVARPVDYLDNFLPSVWLLTDEKSGVRRAVLGFFNWEKQAGKIGTTLAKAGLDPTRVYHAFDFWNNELLADIRGKMVTMLPPESCRVIALRAAEGRPVLLSTSRHITQGIVDVARERWTGKSLNGVSHVIGGDPYELRVRVPDGWTVNRAAADVPVQTTVTNGLLRVMLGSPSSQPVKWTIRFCRP